MGQGAQSIMYLSYEYEDLNLIYRTHIKMSDMGLEREGSAGKSTACSYR